MSDLLENYRKWMHWIIDCSGRFHREWGQPQGDEAERKLKAISFYQGYLKTSFGGVIDQCEDLITENPSCGVNWFYEHVLQDNKPSEYVKDCADIAYYEMPQDEKYADTFMLKVSNRLCRIFEEPAKVIFPAAPEPLSENAEWWKIDEWNEAMYAHDFGVEIKAEEVPFNWLIVYLLVVALYAALTNERAFLVKEGEAVDDGEFVLPEEIDTERARKYFPIAIEAGFMKMTADGKGCRWTFGGNRGKVRLAYFLVKVYCPTNTENLPLKAVEKFFNEERLDSANNRFNGTNKGQKWIPIIDELFED